MLYLVRSRHVPANREHACAHPWWEQIAYHPHRRRYVIPTQTRATAPSWPLEHKLRQNQAVLLLWSDDTAGWWKMWKQMATSPLALLEASAV